MPKKIVWYVYQGLNTAVLFDFKIPKWTESLHGLNAYQLREKEEL